MPFYISNLVSPGYHHISPRRRNIENIDVILSSRFLSILNHDEDISRECFSIKIILHFRDDHLSANVLKIL
jgi:hypothetical protein